MNRLVPQTPLPNPDPPHNGYVRKIGPCLWTNSGWVGLRGFVLLRRELLE